MKRFILLGPLLVALSMVLTPTVQAQWCDTTDTEKTIQDADIGFRGLWIGKGKFRVLEVYKGLVGDEVGVDFLAFGPTDKLFLVDPPFDIESEVYIFAFKWASLSDYYREIGQKHDYYTNGCSGPTLDDPREKEKGKPNN